MNRARRPTRRPLDGRSSSVSCRPFFPWSLYHRRSFFLRHYEDLPPRKIALRLGIPIEAVKSRLRRAYDRLRARLDEGASGNVEGWRTALALQPLVGWDIAAHLSKPGPAIGNGALHGGIIAVTTGTKIGLGAALLLVIVGGTLLLSRHEGSKGERSGTEEINAPGATHPALSGLAPRGGSPSHRAADPLPVPQSPSPQAGEGPTERELLDLARSVGPRRIEGIALLGREPATQGTARVWRRTLTDRLFYDRTTEGAVVVPIGRDGTFAFNDVDPGEYTFIVEVPGYAPRLVGQTVTDQASRRRVLVLGSGRIEGHVFDQDGRPLGDIVVQVSQGGDGTYLGRGSTAEVRSKADGTYSVDGLVSGPYWVISYVRQDRTALDASIGLKCDVLAEKTAVLDFGTPTPSPTWSGTSSSRRRHASPRARHLRHQLSGADCLLEVPCVRRKGKVRSPHPARHVPDNRGTSSGSPTY